MNHSATHAPMTRDLWRSIPLDCVLSAVAIILAAGLKLAGLIP